MTGGCDRWAARLVRCYPRRWRERFPDVIEVLGRELSERPVRAVASVVAASSLERLRTTGLVSPAPGERARSGLALVVAALVPFAALATGMWSQLRTGIDGAGPSASGVFGRADLLLAAGAVLTAAGLVAAVGLVTARGGWARRSRPPGAAPSRRSVTGAVAPRAGPVVVFAGSMAALWVAGWTADRSGWYSPAAAALPGHGAGHLLTLWVRGLVAPVTPAWVHPALFGRMPAGDLFATLVAPLAASGAVAALVRLVVRLPGRVPGRADVTLAVGAALAMTLSVAAMARWLVAQSTGEAVVAHAGRLAPGHTGWAVLGLLAVLTGIALVGTRRVLEGRAAGHPPAVIDTVP